MIQPIILVLLSDSHSLNTQEKHVPRSAPLLLASSRTEVSTDTSASPKLTPRPAIGWTRCAASLELEEAEEEKEDGANKRQGKWRKRDGAKRTKMSKHIEWIFHKHFTYIQPIYSR